MNCCQHRIDGATVWIGDKLTGGNYEGAAKVGTVKYEEGEIYYIFSGISKTGSSVEIQGAGTEELQLTEVQVYGKLLLWIIFYRLSNNCTRRFDLE